MRLLFLLLVCFKIQAQQTFIELDSLSSFPGRTYDSLAKFKCILLGEMHGTKQAPIILSSLTDLFARHGKVIIALEIPEKNQKVIDRYLKGGDKNLIPQLDFFNEVKDGRSSEAIAKFIENAYGRKNVTLFCFDVDDYKGHESLRDSLMARNILKIKKTNPDAVLISLSGNIHSNTKKGFRNGYETMGYYLKQELGTSLISLTINYKGGTAYNCMQGGCKERQLETDTSQFKDYLRKEAFILIDKAFEATGIDGIIYLREVSASVPFLPE